MTDDLTKTPRLYTPHALSVDMPLPLDEGQTHYLRNVMRREAGDRIRLFNGMDGEWGCVIEQMGKKSCIVRPQVQTREQEGAGPRLHLVFAPIAKDRMFWLIEKAVELGVTDLHPVLTQNTDIRKINEERLRAQMTEAAEQCERMDMPLLHPMLELAVLLQRWDIPLLAAIERREAPPLIRAIPAGACGILIGPSGGFSAAEMDRITATPVVRAISLGSRILRSETAAAAALAIVQAARGQTA